MQRPGIALLRPAAAVALLLALVPAPTPAAPVGPAIYHTPVVTAARGSSIGITAVATCDQRPINEACTARVFYRVTVPGSQADLLASGDPAWPSVQMNRDPGINAGSQTVYSFFAQIPGADTRGMDYIIKVTDGGVSSYSPGTPGAVGAGQTSGMRTGAYHVFVTSPPNVTHVPVATGAFRTPIPIRADATCATRCSATLFFRRTGLLQPSLTDLDDPPPNPAEGTDVQWAAISMPITGQIQNDTTDAYGASTYTFQADIPSTYVDTRGVDYAIKVSDGATRSYWPGTAYTGFGTPADGSRIGWQHVHVLNPVLAAHRQTIYTTTRNVPVDLTVDAVCWTTSCSASVQYHVFGGAVQSMAMAQRNVSIVGNAKVITYGAIIPAGSVIYPSLSYRFTVKDGYTTAYSPGTFYTGHYVKADGAPLGEYTVAVV